MYFLLKNHSCNMLQYQPSIWNELLLIFSIVLQFVRSFPRAFPGPLLSELSDEHSFPCSPRKKKNTLMIKKGNPWFDSPGSKALIYPPDSAPDSKRASFGLRGMESWPRNGRGAQNTERTTCSFWMGGKFNIDYWMHKSGGRVTVYKVLSTKR